MTRTTSITTQTQQAFWLDLDAFPVEARPLFMGHFIIQATSDEPRLNRSKTLRKTLAILMTETAAGLLSTSLGNR